MPVTYILLTRNNFIANVLYIFWKNYHVLSPDRFGPNGLRHLIHMKQAFWRKRKLSILSYGYEVEVIIRQTAFGEITPTQTGIMHKKCHYNVRTVRTQCRSKSSYNIMKCSWRANGHAGGQKKMVHILSNNF